MSSYAQLNSTKDTIITIYNDLYGPYTFLDGSTTGNIELFSDSALLEINIVPVIDNKPTFDPTYQGIVVTTSTISLDQKTVVRNWEIVDKNLLVMKLSKETALTFLRDSKINSGLFDINTINNQYLNHKSNIEACTTSQEVANYNITTGW